MNHSNVPFSAKELQDIATKLNEEYNLEGPQLCNTIFGFENWSSEVRELRLYFTTESSSESGRTYSSGASALCRIILRDGAHRDAPGYGESIDASTKMKSIGLAQKAAIHDGIHQCLNQFKSSMHKEENICSLKDSTSANSGSGVDNNHESETLHKSGRKRGLPPTPYEHPASNASRHAPASSHLVDQSPSCFSSATACPPKSASPTIEDVDSLMQQYDKVGDLTDQSRRQVATNTRVSSHPGTVYPAVTSLKGQKYPSKPNLQDPFKK